MVDEGTDNESTVQSIMASLVNSSGWADTSEEERAMLTNQASTFLSDGWTRHDVFMYLSATEYVNPNLPEKTAVDRMNALRAKYSKKSV